MVHIFLKIKEIKKKKVDTIIIKGPAGNPVVLESKIPKEELKTPKKIPPREN